MNMKINKEEYIAPNSEMLDVDALSVLCASQGTSVEPFTEDDDLAW